MLPSEYITFVTLVFNEVSDYFVSHLLELLLLRHRLRLQPFWPRDQFKDSSICVVGASKFLQLLGS